MGSSSHIRSALVARLESVTELEASFWLFLFLDFPLAYPPPVVVVVVQSLSCVQLSDPMDYSMSGFPVHHHLTELALTHVS